MSAAAALVRTRRAYFDCKFGQLHVRTAFPTTGGFDELVTLICLHPGDQSSRIFSKILPLLADVRSVYAPDLPGCGESDPSPSPKPNLGPNPGPSRADAAAAIADLADDLRLRQIDVLGMQFGAAVALELAAARPELVRRLVLAEVPAAAGTPAVAQKRLVVQLAGWGDPAFDAASSGVVRQINAFLSAHA